MDSPLPTTGLPGSATSVEPVSVKPWPNRLKWGVLGAFLGLSFLVAYGIGRDKVQSQPPPAPAQTLTVSAADLDMGEVWEEKELRRQLPIHNETNQTIEIAGFTTSCACASVETRSLSILPGQTSSVTVTFNTTHRRFAEQGLARRGFGTTISPNIINGKRPVPRWDVHGIVNSRVTLEPAAIHFGERPIQGETVVTQTVVAIVHVPCKRLEVKVDSAVARVTVERDKIDAKRFDLKIAPNPALSVGDFSTEMTVSVVGEDDRELFGTAQTIDGKMQPEVRLLPARVFLGTHPLGGTAEAVVTLQAAVGVKAAVAQIETDSTGLMVEPASVEGVPAGYAYRIKQKIGGTGEHMGTVRFVVQKPGKKPITVPVEVSYRGEERTAATRDTQEKQP